MAKTIETFFTCNSECLNTCIVTGIIDEGDSLFTYLSGQSWATYHDRSFAPSYDPQFSNPSLESDAIDACDDDEFCLYDIATTGRIEIGLSTLDGSRSFDEIVTLSYPSKQLLQKFIVC